MNLADAIRSAALRAEVVADQLSTPTPPSAIARAAVSASTPETNPIVNSITKPWGESSTPTPSPNPVEILTDTPSPSRSHEMNTPESNAPANLDPSHDLSPAVAHNSNTNMVRLELFLGPEQLQGLLRAMVQTHHSVMTLREAASYLRLTPIRLETLAHDRMLPAFQIDGKWRFSKAGLDEWLTLQAGLAEQMPLENEA